MPTKTIRVVAHLTAREDRIEDACEALMELLGPTRAEQGCIFYDLAQNNDDPTDFTFVEEWETDEMLDAHLESEHIRKLQSRADDLFAAPPDIRRYTLIA